MGRRWSVSFALVMFLSATPASASDESSTKKQSAKEPKSVRIVVLDVTGTGQDTTENRAFLFESGDSIDGKLLSVALDDYYASTNGDSGISPNDIKDGTKKRTRTSTSTRQGLKSTRSSKDDSTQAQIGTLLDKIRENGGRSTRRWISYKGDMVRVYTFRPQSYDLKFTFDEKGRETQLGSDIATLFRAVAEKSTFTEGAQPTVVSKSTKVLKRTRATLTIRADPGEVQELGAGLTGFGMTLGDGLFRAIPESERPKVKTKLASAEMSLTTGPTEHWYLSTSVPLNSIEQVQYVDSTARLEPKDKPKKFLLGANFLVGDLLSDRGLVSPTNLALGIFVEASSKPFESVGGSISYRFRDFNAWGVNLDLVTPFWGVIRTENDSRPAQGSSEVQTHVVWNGAWGISLNLDKVAAWLSGK